MANFTMRLITIILAIIFCFTNSYAEPLDFISFEKESDCSQNKDFAYVKSHYRKGCITKKGHIRSGSHVRGHRRK
jgi:hypothetical protein